MSRETPQAKGAQASLEEVGMSRIYRDVVLSEPTASFLPKVEDTIETRTADMKDEMAVARAQAQQVRTQTCYCDLTR